MDYKLDESAGQLRLKPVRQNFTAITAFAGCLAQMSSERGICVPYDVFVVAVTCARRTENAHLLTLGA